MNSFFSTKVVCQMVVSFYSSQIILSDPVSTTVYLNDIDTNHDCDPNTSLPCDVEANDDLRQWKGELSARGWVTAIGKNRRLCAKNRETTLFAIASPPQETTLSQPLYYTSSNNKKYMQLLI
jgi:hypothetical protein